MFRRGLAPPTPPKGEVRPLETPTIVFSLPHGVEKGESALHKAHFLNVIYAKKIPCVGLQRVAKPFAGVVRGKAPNY